MTVYDDGTAIEKTDRIRRQGPREVVSDAYQEYVQARREHADVDKISTLTLTQSDMRSIGLVIAEAVAAEEDRLNDEAKRKWGRILRGLQNAVAEAS